MSDYSIPTDRNPFAGQNTSSLNGNGILAVRPQDNLVPMFPNVYTMASNGMSRGSSPIGQPSPLGIRLQFDATDPTNPAYCRFMAAGQSFGVVYAGDIGDTAGSYNQFFQPFGALIHGEPLDIDRTAELTTAITPFTSGNQRVLLRKIWRDLGDTQYPVEIRVPGDRLNTTGNRCVIYAFLVDPSSFGVYGGDAHLVKSGGSVSTSMSTVNFWSNTGSQPFAVQQIDVYNSTAGALTVSLQIDGSNTRHSISLAAGDTKSIFAVGRPVTQDSASIKMQASGSGVVATIIGTAGF